MDMSLFFEKLMSDKSINDIPAEMIIRVAVVVFNIINAGECYHEKQERKVYVD